MMADKLKVCKFGGTSLADANKIRKVVDIVQADPERQYVVVSAPGKRYGHDCKITDLFYEWHRENQMKLLTEKVQEIIKSRYAGIINDLGIEFDLDYEFVEINRKIGEGVSDDYVASRGEYLMAKIMAIALDYQFVDAAICIKFDRQGRYIKNYGRIQEALKGRRVVIPGFYGSYPDGAIKTFSRGGSDITGAIIASAMGATVYENWTDVPGLLMADPGVVNCPKKIDIVTYHELRELAYAGAKVFQEEAMFPVWEVGITTNIRNTNDSSGTGTLIVAELDLRESSDIITGIAGRKNFTVITVEKKMMNQEVGFAKKVLTVLEENKISFEHMPSGIDTLSIIIDTEQLGEEKFEKVLHEIQKSCLPDEIKVCPYMAMIAIVGQGMIHTPGVAAKIFTAVAKEGINIRMINQGSSEISIIIGVENSDYENTIRAIYNTFVR